MFMCHLIIGYGVISFGFCAIWSVSNVMKGKLQNPDETSLNYLTFPGPDLADVKNQSDISQVLSWLFPKNPFTRAAELSAV